MERGDLSARLAPIVGVRFENVVYNYGKVNEPGKAFVESLLSKDVNLYLFSTLSERKVRSWCWKWGVMYTRTVEASSTLEIPELCKHHKVGLYIDTDDRLLEAVGMTPYTEIQKWEQTLGSTESINH